MKPRPWSFSALDDFINCPRSFEAKRVSKSVVEPRSPQMIWGEEVHKEFEDRLAVNKPLRLDLQEHEPYIAAFEALDGMLFTEQKIALNKKLKPTSFFSYDVWFRGIIDASKIDSENRCAKVIDYKTGKRHTKPNQLILFALYVFAMYPEVDEVCSEFYWTKEPTNPTTNIYTRDQMDALWSKFVPDLRQYMEAFKTETWQARPSGLCNGWCPVTECEHWKPKKVRP